MEVYVHTPITILKTDDGDIPYSKASKEQQVAYDVGEIEGEKLSYFKKDIHLILRRQTFLRKNIQSFLTVEFHLNFTEAAQIY